MLGIATVSVVGIILLYWLFILFKLNIKAFKQPKDDDNTHNFSGRFVNGKIIASQSFGKGKNPRMKIQVEFPNFSGADVIETFIFRDTKPELNRYTVGNAVQLILEEDPKKGPSIKLANAKKSMPNAIKVIAFVLLAGYSYFLYFLYNLLVSKAGKDFSGIENLFHEPSTLIMGLVMFGTLILNFTIFRAVGLVASSKSKNLKQELKFYGIRTIGTITGREDTNTRINNHPVIRFHYSFTDDSGQERTGTDKKTLDAVQLANLGATNQVDILYLRDNPDQSTLMENTGKNVLGGCVNVIFYFIGIVFTCVVVGKFIADLTLW